MTIVNKSDFDPFENIETFCVFDVGSRLKCNLLCSLTMSHNIYVDQSI